MSARERAYRALVALYPARFSEEHGECLLGTLLDGAPERGAVAEARELAGLGAGALRARGEEARRAGRGGWRHGVAALLAPLAAVNLAIVATAAWAVPGRFGAWWAVALLSATGLVVAVGLRRRAAAVACAVLGLVPLGYDEWLQATGRGSEDHISIAAQNGFAGPEMSPFWLFAAGVIVVAALPRLPRPPGGRPLLRLAALTGAAAAIAALEPQSFAVLVGLALAGTLACTLLGGLDRRLYGAGVALWVILLPFVTWWWAASPLANQVWPILAFAALAPLMAAAAWIARRRRPPDLAA